MCVHCARTALVGDVAGKHAGSIAIGSLGGLGGSNCGGGSGEGGQGSAAVDGLRQHV